MTEENLIDSVCERIKFDRDQLAGDGLPRVEVESFNLSEFWPQLESAAQALSNEVTKVNFMCNTKPFPTKSEVSISVLDILQYYNMVRDLYLVLPEEVGDFVFKATSTAILNITKVLYDVVCSFHDLTEKASEDRFRLVGTFWVACNAVEKLPKNNLLATLNLFEEESALASDALEELETVNKNADVLLTDCYQNKQESESCIMQYEMDKEKTKKSNTSDLCAKINYSLSEAAVESCKSGSVFDSHTSSETEKMIESQSVDDENNLIINGLIIPPRLLNMLQSNHPDRLSNRQLKTHRWQVYKEDGTKISMKAFTIKKHIQTFITDNHLNSKVNKNADIIPTDCYQKKHESESCIMQYEMDKGKSKKSNTSDLCANINYSLSEAGVESCKSGSVFDSHTSSETEKMIESQSVDNENNLIINGLIIPPRLLNMLQSNHPDRLTNKQLKTHRSEVYKEDGTRISMKTNRIKKRIQTFLTDNLLNSKIVKNSPNEKENQKQSKDDVIGENEHAIVKSWILDKMAINRPADLATLEEDLTAVKSILQKLDENINDPIFFGLTLVEKGHKGDSLRLKYSDLMLIKSIIERFPKVLESVKASIENFKVDSKKALTMGTIEEVALPNRDEKALYGTIVPEISSKIQTSTSHQIKSNPFVTTQQTSISGPNPVGNLNQQASSPESIFGETGLVPFNQQAGRCAPNPVGISTIGPPTESYGYNPVGTNFVPLRQQADFSEPDPVVTSLPQSQQISGSVHNPIETRSVPVNHQASSAIHNSVETSWPILSQIAGSSEINPNAPSCSIFSQVASSSVPNPVGTGLTILSQIAGSSEINCNITSWSQSQQIGSSAPNPVGTSCSILSQGTSSSGPIPVGTSWSTLDKEKAGSNMSNYVEMPIRIEIELRSWIQQTILNKKPVNLDTLQNEISHINNLKQQNPMYSKVKRTRLTAKLNKLLYVKEGFEACQAKGVSVLNYSTHVLSKKVVQDPYYHLRAFKDGHHSKI